jgi:hypothetical protein
VHPQYHWTDQKLHVHAFCRVLAPFRSLRLLQRQARLPACRCAAREPGFARLHGSGRAWSPNPVRADAPAGAISSRNSTRPLTGSPRASAGSRPVVTPAAANIPMAALFPARALPWETHARYGRPRCWPCPGNARRLNGREDDRGVATGGAIVGSTPSNAWTSRRGQGAPGHAWRGGAPPPMRRRKAGSLLPPSTSGAPRRGGRAADRQATSGRGRQPIGQPTRGRAGCRPRWAPWGGPGPPPPRGRGGGGGG